jgi:predicted Rossmann fold flavoprotein
MNFDLIILGAGASGLALAYFLKQSNPKLNFAIIDKNREIGQKLLISGGGKCNITNKNISENNFLGDSDFFKNIYSQFNNTDLLDLLAKNHIKFNLLNNSVNNQYFLNSSKEIINFYKKNNFKLYLNSKIQDINYKNNEFILNTENSIFRSKYLVVASGGLSYSQIGATDIGFKIAEKFGHKIINLKPALVGFTVQKEQFWFKNLSGVSIFAEIKISISKNNFKKFRGNILFTHKGISGPIILLASLYWEKYQLEIDFLPNLNLENIISNRKKSNFKNKTLISLLELPKKFIHQFLESENIRNKKISEFKIEEIEKIKKLKNYKFAPAGNFGFNRAEVTKGGIDTAEIDFQNLESKLQKNLFFIGEVLNMTGELGGYNIQWAFSSAFVCSKFLTSK